jgi:tRNA modification GTPase
VTDTLVACLTPAGRSALATLALHGPLAWKVVRDLFRPRSGPPLPEVPLERTFRLGRFGREPAEEVVLAVRRVDHRAPQECTWVHDDQGTQARPTPWLEIHSHGGREVVRLLLELLTAEGLSEVPWPEFLRRTTPDALEARAAVALAHAPTVRTAALLLDQFHGALSAALSAVAASLKVGADERATTLLTELAARVPLGRHLTEPWQVVVAGAPNVGKSSLVNALAGYQRSIVAATPGTTRDVVTIKLALDGWPVELADTAGLREQAETLEEQGIARARSRLQRADLILWVLDAGAEPVLPSERTQRLLLVVNKTDLPPAWDLDRVGEAVRVSARTGEGIGDLSAAITRRLVPDAPGEGTPIPFTEEVCSAVAEALRLLSAGAREQACAVIEKEIAHDDTTGTVASGAAGAAGGGAGGG